MGALARQDPISGAVISKPWIADRNFVVPDRKYRVPQHPMQIGTIVNDVIQELPRTFSVDFILSDVCTPTHPIRSFHQRSRYLAAQFQTIEFPRGPVLLWARGITPARDLAITSVQHNESRTERTVTLTVSFERMQFTTIVVVPLAIDVELLAAGIVPL